MGLVDESDPTGNGLATQVSAGGVGRSEEPTMA